VLSRRREALEFRENFQNTILNLSNFVEAPEGMQINISNQKFSVAIIFDICYLHSLVVNFLFSFLESGVCHGQADHVKK
jgi:hypothetical protein